MENTEKINLNERPVERVRNDGPHIPSCPIWIFGNEDSADKDLKGKFEVVDEENKSNK